MLMWSWNEKVGEIRLYQNYGNGDKEFTIDLYKGNALLIGIEREKRSMYTFFCDIPHMKRCLGIDKKCQETYGDNQYDKDYDRWLEVVLYKDNYPEYKKVIPVLVEAFRDISIRVMNKPEENVEGK